MIGLGVATLLLALCTGCLGVVGYVMGMRNVEAAVGFADPEQRALLLQVGQAEAQNNLEMGACASVLPLLLGVVALVRGLTMPRAGASDPRG